VSRRARFASLLEDPRASVSLSKFKVEVLISFIVSYHKSVGLLSDRSILDSWWRTDEERQEEVQVQVATKLSIAIFIL